MERFLRRSLVLLAVLNVVSSQVHERIVGGFSGNIADYPWVVNLRYDGFPACGGSIISSQWILTACHCFPKDHELNKYVVIAGSTNLEPADSDAQIVNILEVFMNPTYNEDAYSGDMALVKVEGQLTMGPRVNVISLLAASVQVPPGLTCYVTGWGNVRHGETLANPKTLQVGQVKIISRRTCQCLHNISPSSNGLTSIQSDMTCAGYKEGTTDACQGDSGGPLSCQINGNWFQVGVVSWGEECGMANKPGVYILPSAYIDWIRSLVPDLKVAEITIDQTPVPDQENGCVGADGGLYPYPNRGTVTLLTVSSLLLYWLTVYLLTDL